MEPEAVSSRLTDMENMTRPGRECKRCGENRSAMMLRDPRSTDGHRMLCNACAQTRATELRAKLPTESREANRARTAEWHAAHPERISEIQASWIAANPERRQEIRRASRIANRETSNLIAARRRSRLAAASCAPARRSDLAALPFGCGHAGPFHLDHIIPIAAGGCANAHNLQWLCAACNQSKSDSLPAAGFGCPGFWA